MKIIQYPIRDIKDLTELGEHKGILILTYNQLLALLQPAT